MCAGGSLGKNYVEHARELGDAVPDKPVVFLKPPSACVAVGAPGATQAITLPSHGGEVHYETEIVLEVGEGGGFSRATLGLDLTLRTLQAQLKKAGHPWEISKVFPGSAILGPMVPLDDFPEYMDTEFVFTLDGKVRQRGRGSEMTMKPADALEYVGQFFPICPGDLLFTGTPKGVGPITSGQTAELVWGDKLNYRITVS